MHNSSRSRRRLRCRCGGPGQSSTGRRGPSTMRFRNTSSTLSALWLTTTSYQMLPHFVEVPCRRSTSALPSVWADGRSLLTTGQVIHRIRHNPPQLFDELVMLLVGHVTTGRYAKAAGQQLNHL